jgi:transcriptional regulator with XRE-family HTH domain
MLKTKNQLGEIMSIGEIQIDAINEAQSKLVAQLKARRIELGITHRELANLSGLLPSTIWRLESGKANSRRPAPKQALVATILSYAWAINMDLVLVSDSKD